MWEVRAKGQAGIQVFLEPWFVLQKQGGENSGNEVELIYVHLDKKQTVVERFEWNFLLFNFAIIYTYRIC